MRFPLWRRRRSEELEEELRAHLDEAIRERMERGETRAEAEAAARREFGNVGLVREATRDAWGWASLDRLAQDVRYGLGQMRRRPVFAGVAILTLGAAIGTSTLVFSFANGVLFRPIHATNPEEIVQVFTGNSRGYFDGSSSYADYMDFQKVPVFSGLLAWMRTQATLGHDERSELVTGFLVSANYFEVLGLRPVHGRFFRAEENQTPGTHAVAVLSHETWRRRFGSDPGIVGRNIELNGTLFSVIGVAPPQFTGTSVEFAADFFAPVMMQAAIAPDGDYVRNRGFRAARLLGRLRSGVTLPEAQAAMDVMAAQLFQEHPETWRNEAGRGRAVTILPELEGRFGRNAAARAEISAGVTGTAVGLLAIACVNVATVLLAQATARRKEMAVRLALGASRRRLVRQLLTECALLAAAGGVLGVQLAQWGAALFTRFRPEEVPPFDLTPDYRVLLFALAASLITVVFFGLAPALQTTKQNLNAELNGTAPVVRLRGLRFSLRSGLVVAQVALSLALLIGATLMLRSSYAGRTEDPGFRRRDVLNVHIHLPTLRERGTQTRFYGEAVRAAEALPGVERVALAALVPLSGSNSQVEIRIAEGGSMVTVSPDINIVGAGYFSLLEIPVQQGREFTGADHETAQVVALVNEKMARRYWNGDAVGKSFTEEASGALVQIVGVVRDVTHREFNDGARPMVYFCASQRPRQRMTLHVRTAAPRQAIAPALQRALREVERAAAVTPAETMDEYLTRMTMPQRAGAGVAVAAGAMEMALAVMALYGLIAFAATQRKREIGLRMALGASKQSVVRLIVHEGLLLTVAGVALGAILAGVGGMALSSLLIGVGPLDPLTYAGAALALILAAATASYVPARRAARVDPMAALRHE